MTTLCILLPLWILSDHNQPTLQFSHSNNSHHTCSLTLPGLLVSLLPLPPSLFSPSSLPSYSTFIPILSISLSTSPTTDHSFRFLCSYINWLNDLKVKSKTNIFRRKQRCLSLWHWGFLKIQKVQQIMKMNRQHRIGKYPNGQ